MSSLYTMINQEAAKQKEQVEQSRSEEAVVKSDQSEKPQSPTPKQSTSKKRKNRSSERPNGRTVDRTPERITERSRERSAKPASLIEEMKSPAVDAPRSTERYSFEIYSDQKETINDIQYQYKKRTGQQLPKSRIIREALDLYLAQLSEEQSS